MNNSKILVLKMTRQNPFEKFYAEEMAKTNIQVVDVSPENMKGSSVRRLANIIRYYLKLKKKIRSEKIETIILFGKDIVRTLLLWIIKPSKCRLILWQWNTFGMFQKRMRIHKLFAEIWTYDKNDALKNNWPLNTQFFFKRKDPMICSSANNREVFFVGYDKGRCKVLAELVAHLSKINNIDSAFYIIPDEQTDLNVEGITYLKEMIPYDVCLRRISNALCVVDIVKKGQVGLTTRVLESIFYKKKLITNNVDVKNLEIYNSANMFVIGIDSWERLPEFLSSQYQPLNDDMIDYYTVEQWLKRFSF